LTKRARKEIKKIVYRQPISTITKNQNLSTR